MVVVIVLLLMFGSEIQGDLTDYTGLRINLVKAHEPPPATKAAAMKSSNATSTSMTLCPPCIMEVSEVMMTMSCEFVVR